MNFVEDVVHHLVCDALTANLILWSDFAVDTQSRSDVSTVLR